MEGGREKQMQTGRAQEKCQKKKAARGEQQESRRRKGAKDDAERERNGKMGGIMRGRGDRMRLMIWG